MIRTNAVLSASLAVLSIAGLASADNPGDEPEVVQWYGSIRLDAIYDDSRMNNAQTPEWVEEEATEETEDLNEFTIHPRLSRLGVDVAPRKISKAEVNGKVEIDFQNGGRESSQIIRLRDAYLEVKHDIFELLAGQTEDLVSPLIPTANGDSLMWNVGNLGDRRPQLRGTVVFPAAGGALRISAAAGQTGATDQQDIDGDGRLDGIEAGVPNGQGLIEFRKSGVRLGIWAHGGFEQLSTPIGDVDGFGSWAAGGHLHIPFQERLYVRGELHHGRNIDDLRGGIGQGINVALAEGIRSTGGWAEIGAKIRDPYTIAVSVFIENPENDDLEDGAREVNWAYAITQRIRVKKKLSVGIDYLFWKTEYKNAGSGTANRGSAFVRLDF